MQQSLPTWFVVRIFCNALAMAHSVGESGLVGNTQLTYGASGPLRRTCWDDDA